MNVRIYYEDTDAAGVVYHSNYLNYFERARTEYLRERGLSVARMAGDGHVFPVVRMEIDFRAPGRLEDLLEIETAPVCAGGLSFTLKQTAVRLSDGRILVEALVTLACVSTGLKARRIPPEVRRVLEDDLTDRA